MFIILSILLTLHGSPVSPANPLPTENCKGETKNNQKTGHWQCFYDDGKLMQEGNYTAGKKEGIWKLYHANGKLAGEGPYANDAEKGKWKFFDDEGKLILEQEY
jgi:antitoxin component YwqK of YwqJK toxin-antitoxin module